jgi:succinate dehydrogenase / fumarate reductase cytochrome b subunit
MANSKFSTIGRKVLMALSGLFLVSFLVIHVSINLVSVFSEEAFNEASHFMGTNPVIQFVMQPVLMFGVFFHLIMGIILELQNNKAREVKYAFNKPSANSNWMSRNMIYTGAVIMAFLGLHLYDFWMHEMVVKYIEFQPEDPNRYFHETVEKFQDPIRVLIYLVSFVALALHLLHGFQSSFQSVGFNHTKYTPLIKKAGNAFAIVVPAVFAFIAIYHYLNPITH